MKKFFLILSIILCIVFSTGCGNTQQESESTKVETNADTQTFAVIEDDIGRKVILNHKPERIAVTSASFLEPLHAVGGNIVGRPESKTSMPNWAKDIAGIGQVYQIDVERLLVCDPDLVILNKGMNEKLIGVLDENHIPSIVMEMKTYEDVKREIRTFATISNNADEGEKIISKMDLDIKKIIDKIPAEKKRVAILHSTAQGLSVQLDGSIAGNIVKMFGWENVASGMTPLENNPDAAPYSMETLAEQNPEIIFVTSMGNIDDIRAQMQTLIDSNEAWQTIGAIKDNHIYYLPQNLFLLSPGLNYPEAVETVAKLVYPANF